MGPWSAIGATMFRAWPSGDHGFLAVRVLAPLPHPACLKCLGDEHVDGPRHAHGWARFATHPVHTGPDAGVQDDRCWFAHVIMVAELYRYGVV